MAKMQGIGVDSPTIYKLKDSDFKLKDKAIYMGTVEQSDGKAEHKDFVQIVGLDKKKYGGIQDIAITAKNLRTGEYFKAPIRHFMKNIPFSLNEEIKKIKLTLPREKITLQLATGKKITDYPDLTKESDMNDPEDNLGVANQAWDLVKEILEKDKSYLNDEKFKEFLSQIENQIGLVEDAVNSYNSSDMLSQYFGELERAYKEDNIEEFNSIVDQVDHLMWAIGNDIDNYEEKELEDDKEEKDMNEQFDTLNLKPNTWVQVKGLGRKYIDQVDYRATNPDNKFGHMAVLVKDSASSKDKGQWVSYQDLEYQYDGKEDDTPQDDKPLSNIMNEVRRMRESLKKSANIKVRKLPPQETPPEDDRRIFKYPPGHRITQTITKKPSLDDIEKRNTKDNPDYFHYNKNWDQSRNEAKKMKPKVKKSGQGPTPANYFKDYNKGSAPSELGDDEINMGPNPRALRKTRRLAAKSGNVPDKFEEAIKSKRKLSIEDIIKLIETLPEVQVSPGFDAKFKAKLKAKLDAIDKENSEKNKLSSIEQNKPNQFDESDVSTMKMSDLLKQGKPGMKKYTCPSCYHKSSIDLGSLKEDGSVTCENCGKPFHADEENLAEGKITGALKKWQDEAKKVAKDIFKEKAFNKLSDQEAARCYLDADKKRRMSKVSTMKSSGDINREEDED